MNRNTRHGLLASSFALAAWSVVPGIYHQLTQPITERLGRLASATQSQKAQETSLHQMAKTRQQLLEWEAIALPWDEADAGKIYLPYLTQLAERAGLRQIMLTPTPSEETSIEARWWGVTMTAQGEPSQWTVLLQTFEATPLLHHIAEINLRPSSPENTQGTLRIEVLCMPGGDPERQISLPEAVEAHDSLFGSANWFADRTPRTEPIDVVAAVEPVEKEQPAVYQPPPPPPPSLKLIGTFSLEDRQEAWILDTQTQQHHVYRMGDTIDLPGLQTTLDVVDSRGIQCNSAGETIRWELGELWQ
jgi:hypothetical protein